MFVTVNVDPRAVHIQEKHMIFRDKEGGVFVIICDPIAILDAFELLDDCPCKAELIKRLKGLVEYHGK